MIELIISVYFLFAKLLNHIHYIGAGMIQIRMNFKLICSKLGIKIIQKWILKIDPTYVCVSLKLIYFKGFMNSDSFLYFNIA